MSIEPEVAAKARLVLSALDRKKVVRVTGAAGTGKTTLIRAVVTEHPDAAVVAYTGQAARMLRGRGVASASTIHSCIYLPTEERRERVAELRGKLDRETDADERRIIESQLAPLLQPTFLLRDNITASVFVVDEASMVGERIADDLISFGIPVVAVGDANQLPPVGDKPGFDLSGAVDVRLTKILRQEAGSPIIDLATRIAAGQVDDFRAVRGVIGVKPDMSMNNDTRKGFMLRADQILASTNKTRMQVNKRMLGYHGLPTFPTGDAREKLICRRNNGEYGVFNGQPVQLRNVRDQPNSKFFLADVLADDGGDDLTLVGERVRIWKGWFQAHAEGRPNYEAWQRRAAIEFDRIRSGALELDWAFCLTVHKAQGSEWDNVLYISDARWPTGDERRRMQYTAVTRARDKLMVITDWGVRQ